MVGEDTDQRAADGVAKFRGTQPRIPSFPVFCRCAVANAIGVERVRFCDSKVFRVSLVMRGIVCLTSERLTSSLDRFSLL